MAHGKNKFPRARFILSLMIGAAMILITWFAISQLAAQSRGDGKDAAEYWGDIATIIGVALALFGFLFALRQYNFDARSRRTAHMHSLFGAFLRMRFDLALAAATQANGTAATPSGGRPAGKGEPAGDVGHADRPDRSADLAETMLSFRLYTLEEMLEWIRRERRHVAWPSYITAEGRLRLGYLEGWEETIVSHLEPEKACFARYFEENARCYGTPFLELVQERFPDSCGKSILNTLENRSVTKKKKNKKKPGEPAPCPAVEQAKAEPGR